MPTATCCSIVDPGMGVNDSRTVAEQFKALSDPTRVRLLNLLARNEELCVCELQAHFDLSQGTISHHLGVLRRAGLIEGRELGRWVFYRADTSALEALGRVLEVR